MTDTTEAAAIAELAVRASGVSLQNNMEGRQFLVLPEGFQTKDVSEPNTIERKRPFFIDQQVTVQTLDSLVEYVNKFKSADTLLFADIQQSVIVAALDYHSTQQAERLAHSATMRLEFSEEWSTWSGINDKLMKQLDFARFIEENSADIKVPNAAELLECCRDLQAARSANFKKAIRTNTDHENFEFAENTDLRAKNGVEVPTKFELDIPVYFGERNVPLQAFLRWNLQGEGLVLGVKLHRAEHVRQALFKEIVLGASDRTNCPAVYGKA